jgi:hypothetical protein
VAPVFQNALFVFCPDEAQTQNRFSRAVGDFDPPFGAWLKIAIEIAQHLPGRNGAA